MYSWIAPMRPRAGAMTDAHLEQFSEDTQQVLGKLDELIDRVERLDNGALSRTDHALLSASIFVELKTIRERIRARNVVFQNLLEDAIEHLNAGGMQ